MNVNLLHHMIGKHLSVIKKYSNKSQQIIINKVTGEFAIQTANISIRPTGN